MPLAKVIISDNCISIRHKGVNTNPTLIKEVMGSMMKRTRTIISSVILVAIISIAGSSCQKDTTCKGDIFVVRADNGKAIPTCKVWSRYAAKSDSQHTDVSGRVHIELNLPAILTVTAYRPAAYPNAQFPATLLDSASTTLKFEAGVTNSVTIKL